MALYYIDADTIDNYTLIKRIDDDSISDMFPMESSIRTFSSEGFRLFANDQYSNFYFNDIDFTVSTPTTSAATPEEMLIYLATYCFTTTNIPSVTYTASTWIGLVGDDIQFTGGTVEGTRILATEVSRSDVTKTTSRVLGDDAIDTATFTIHDDILDYDTASAEYKFGATQSLFTINEWIDGEIVSVNEFKVTPTGLRVSALGNMSPNVVIVDGSGTFDTMLIDDLLVDYPTNSEMAEALSEYSKTSDVLLKSAGYTGTLTIGLVNVTIVDGQITATA